MTTESTVPEALSTSPVEERAIRVAQAVLSLLPATSELSVGTPQPAALVDASVWAGAAVATLTASGGTVAVLVGAELVNALAESPMGPLELGTAMQPPLDAAARALGTAAGVAKTLTASDVPLALVDASVAVPFVTGEGTAAVLLVGGIEEPTPAPAVPKTAPKAAPGTSPRTGIELLHGVALDVTVELGRSRLSVRELLALTPGDVLELDRAAGSPADLLVNGRLIARGEVVVVDENFALRVTEIVANTAVS